MASKQTPETVRLVDALGNTVTVAAEKAETRLATGYTKAEGRAARQAAKTERQDAKAASKAGRPVETADVEAASDDK